jgi:hypothetical protein
VCVPIQCFHGKFVVRSHISPVQRSRSAEDGEFVIHAEVCFKRPAALVPQMFCVCLMLHPPFDSWFDLGGRTVGSADYLPGAVPTALERPGG